MVVMLRTCPKTSQYSRMPRSRAALPLLGWPLTLARCIPGLLVPPLLGLLGQWLFNLFRR